MFLVPPLDAGVGVDLFLSEGVDEGFPVELFTGLSEPVGGRPNFFLLSNSSLSNCFQSSSLSFSFFFSL